MSVFLIIFLLIDQISGTVQTLNPFQLHMVGDVVGFPEFSFCRIFLDIILDMQPSLFWIFFSPYKHLVRKFNVFIEYQNRMESFEYTRGDMTKIMKVSEDILELYQKERYDKEKFGSRQYDSVVRSDVKNCENIILAVCEGRFPK